MSECDFLLASSYHCAGYITKQHYRPLDDIESILIHRNTVSELWKEAHPADRGLSDVAATWRYHSRELGFSTFPYHFFVDQLHDESVVHQVHTLDVKAPHAGKWNRKTLGIAMNIDGRFEHPSDEMMQTVIWLCALILNKVPDGCDIRGHNKDKRCPGEKVDVEYIKEQAYLLAPALSVERPPFIVSREW